MREHLKFSEGRQCVLRPNPSGASAPVVVVNLATEISAPSAVNQANVSSDAFHWTNFDFEFKPSTADVFVNFHTDRAMARWIQSDCG